jgi:hypothetical protein
VTAGAAAGGCIPLVSSVPSGVSIHDVNALVHAPRDVATMTEHLTVAESDELGERLRTGDLPHRRRLHVGECRRAPVRGVPRDCG